MIFEPKIDDIINIHGKKYVFLQNEAILKDLNLVDEREGGEGIVYKVSSMTNPNEYYALKTFNKNLDSDFAMNIYYSMSKFSEYKNLSGLLVFDRKLIRSISDCPESEQYLELKNSVLMPWIFGNTWHEVIESYLKSKQSVLSNSFNKTICLRLAKSIAKILAGLEENGLAHCDISSGNIIFDIKKDLVELIDVEDMFFPNSDRPALKTIGSSGYKHPHIKSSTWFAEGDRFAGAILICEILVWSNPDIRRFIDNDTFFSNEEFGQYCEKYQAVNNELLTQYSAEIANLFEKAWYSDNISDCFPLSKWVEELSCVEQPQVPVLKVTPLFLDFGRIDEHSSLKLLISNDSSETLRGTISEIDNSWLSIQQRAFELHPQENCTIEISAFTSPNFIEDSLLENTISILSNGGNLIVKASGKVGNRPSLPSSQFPKWPILGCFLLFGLVLLLILLGAIIKPLSSPDPSPGIENTQNTTSIPNYVQEIILDTPTKENIQIMDAIPSSTNTPSLDLIPSNYQCPDLDIIMLQIGVTGMVGKYDINLRNEPIVPEIWDANVVSVLREGDKLKIIGGPQCSHEGTWWEVRTKSGLVGWVREYLPSKGTLIIRIEP